MSMHRQKRATVSVWIITPELFKFGTQCIQMFLSQIKYTNVSISNQSSFQFHNCSVNIYNKWTLQRVFYVTIIGIFLLLQQCIIILVLLNELCIILNVWRVLYFYSSSSKLRLSSYFQRPGNFSSWQAAVSMATCENSLMRATTKLYYRRQQSARHIPWCNYIDRR